MTETVLLEQQRGPRGERVLVRRSRRRTRSVAITRRDGDLIIAMPAAFSRRQEEQWVRRMLDQLAAKESRTTSAPRGDAHLLQLAAELSERYLEGRARPVSVTWSTRQKHRWGSCTAAEGTIRLSTRLQGMPDYVVHAVLVHELAHLLADDGHGPQFRALMARYPEAERAEAFLAGVAWARDWPDPGDGQPAGPVAAEARGSGAGDDSAID